MAWIILYYVVGYLLSIGTIMWNTHELVVGDLILGLFTAVIAVPVVLFAISMVLCAPVLNIRVWRKK